MPPDDKTPPNTPETEDGFLLLDATEQPTLLTLQDQIDDYIRRGKIDSDRKTLEDAFLKTYLTGTLTKIAWPRRTPDPKTFELLVNTPLKSTFEGTLADYIALRKKVMTLSVNESDYYFEQPLKGRGQANVAGFFKKPDEEEVVVIKQDEPGTCLAEGCAVIYTPSGILFTHPPIIQASIQVAHDHEDKPFSVSIQSAFTVKPEQGEEVSSLDVFLLGKKRSPKLPISHEAVFNAQAAEENKIPAQIARFSLDVKKQLASAIYTSQLNGDESLHTAQFMVATRQTRTGEMEITKIQRIDMGALGRFAVARQNATDFDPFNTSRFYETSTLQARKNYISYLVTDPEIKTTLLTLWSNTNTDEVVTAVQKRFKAQIDALKDNPDIKKEALIGFYTELARDASLAIPKDMALDDLEKLVLNVLIATTKSRCENMRELAIKQLASHTPTTPIQEAPKETPKGKFQLAADEIKSQLRPEVVAALNFSDERQWLFINEIARVKKIALSHFDLNDVSALQFITNTFLNSNNADQAKAILQEKRQALFIEEDRALLVAEKIKNPTELITTRQEIREAYQAQRELLHFSTVNNTTLKNAANLLPEAPIPPPYHTPKTEQLKLRDALTLYIKETGGLRGFLTTYQSEKSVKLFSALSKIADEKNPTADSIQRMHTLLSEAKLNPNSRLARKLAETGVISSTAEVTQEKRMKI